MIENPDGQPHDAADSPDTAPTRKLRVARVADLASGHAAAEQADLIVVENEAGIVPAAEIGQTIRDAYPEIAVAAVASAATFPIDDADTAALALRSPLQGLSVREREVLALIARGLRNRDIAERLVITEATVKSHVHQILHKLGVGNRAGAAVLASRWAPDPRPGEA